MKALDILVIGNGLVGASLLLALKPLGFKLGVVDKMNMNETQPPLSARALALSYSSIEILKTLSSFENLSEHATPIHSVHVSLQNHFGCTILTAEEQGLPYLGMVWDADCLHRGLQASLAQQSEIPFFCPDRIKNCEFQEGIWQITLESGQQCQAKLLVGADGTHSFLRQHLGIEAKKENYKQQALVANLHLNHSHDNRAFERFLNPLHSIALLPFGPQKMKSVWVMEEESAEKMRLLSDSEYLKEFQTAFGTRLGRFANIETRFAYSLTRMNSESLYGPGFILMGNAANTLHPLAAQGFNLGLRDVNALIQILTQTKVNNSFSLDLSVLKQYDEKRQRDHFLTQSFTQMLLGDKKIKQIGILASLLLPSVKRILTKQGLGYEWF